MRTAYWLAGILVIVTLSGCMTRPIWPLKRSEKPRPALVAPEKPGEPTFSFVVQSDPVGAEVYQATAKGERLLGKTPLNLSLKLKRQKDDGPMGFFRKGRWQALIPAGVPLAFQEGEFYLTVQIPKLQLRKSGYNAETFTHQWLFPTDLKQNVSKWKSAPIPRKYEETVVFRTPTQPQYNATVEIDSATGKANVHAIDAKGGVGLLIGTTPLECKIGYGQVRSAAGEVTDWIRWHDDNKEIFSHSREGDLLLNCFLVRDGYEPEKIQNRQLLSLRTEKAQEVKAVFQLVRPNKPEANFKLIVDSLPSEAAVYAVDATGALGRQISKTPFELVVGMAQESIEESPGQYVHKDWRIWDPSGIVSWQSSRDGTSVFHLTCAIYKDGFAVENVVQPIFELKPGSPYPKGKTVTIPLPRSEMAAVREAHRLEKARSLAAEQDDRRKSILWQAPPEQALQPASISPAGVDVPIKKPSLLKRWWRGLWKRD